MTEHEHDARIYMRALDASEIGIGVILPHIEGGLSDARESRRRSERITRTWTRIELETLCQHFERLCIDPTLKGSSLIGKASLHHLMDWGCAD